MGGRRELFARANGKVSVKAGESCTGRNKMCVMNAAGRSSVLKCLEMGGLDFVSILHGLCSGSVPVSCRTRSRYGGPSTA